MSARLVIRESLELKELKPHHASALWKLVEQNRKYLREFLGWLDFNRSEKDSETFIVNSLKSNQEGKTLILGIFENNDFIGMCSFGEIHRLNRWAQIGYWLSSAQQGKGIVTAAVQRLVRFGFQEMNLNRIEIRAAPQNQKSCAVAERLGFKKEGLMREFEWLYDHFVDLNLYAMLKSEWRQRQS